MSGKPTAGAGVRRPARLPLRARLPFPARLPFVALLLLVAPLLLAACGSGDRDRVTVGSKFFTEQDLLGELIATWIERTTDLRVRRRLHLGGTFICHRALTTGEIDLYVEYTGTALTAILEREPRHEPDSVYRLVRKAYRERWNLAWTEPLGFENTFAILVRRATADSLGLEKISDLRPHADDLVPGMGFEFLEREDGFPGLRRSYGLEFEAAPRTMEIGLMYRALAEGQVDLVAGNSTDGQIERLDLVPLEDDRGYFPPYDAVPVVRIPVLERHPELEASLDRLGGRIDTPEMRRLNRAVDVEGRDFRRVAREWVDAELADGGGEAGGSERPKAERGVRARPGRAPGRAPGARVSPPPPRATGEARTRSPPGDPPATAEDGARNPDGPGARPP